MRSRGLTRTHLAGTRYPTNFATTTDITAMPLMRFAEEKDLPKAVDLHHHLSDFSRARPLSPLKDLQKYWGKPGILSLAGGELIGPKM